MTRRRDLLSAALRHVRDAEHLLMGVAPCQSIDQAKHLAGFGHECARKALLATAWADKILGHEFGGAAELTLDVVEALDPSCARYPSKAWSVRFPASTQWKPECRYEPTGTAQKGDTEALVRQARVAVDEVALVLWADGVLDGKDLE